MSFEAKPLADGQLPSSLGTLYTVPSGKTAYVKFLSLFNTGSSTENIYIFLKPNASSRCIARAELEQYDSFRAIDKDDGCILEEGDLIEGYASDAGVVDYVISGILET